MGRNLELKSYVPLLMVLLLVSTGFVGVSNTAIESEEDMEQPLETSGPPMDSPWPMKCHDVRHTGRSPYNTADTPGEAKWRFRRWGGMDSSPAIDNEGTIYIGGNKYYGPLWAINPNGTEKWNYKTDGWMPSSPAIAEDGTIYIGSWDAGLYAVNPNGTKKWRFGAGSSIDSSPAIAEDGTIYFGVLGPGNDKGRVYAVNPNGTEKWHYDTGFWVYKSPSIGDDGTVYISSSDNRLYALYPNNGTLKWKFGMGDWPGSPAIADDGTIYVASHDGHLYAVNPDGSLKWKHSIDWGSSQTPSIDDDGTIYIGYKHFYAINPDGTRKWTLVLGEPYQFEVKTSSAISADGIIYFGITLGGVSAGFLIAVNSDGEELWRKVISNDWVYSSPAIGSDGTVYIGSNSNEDGVSYGTLYAFGIGEYEANADGPYFSLINLPVEFKGSVRNGTEPYSWIWDFGDGNTSNEQNPVHVYTRPDNYTVELAVIDTKGNITNDTSWAWIQSSNSPPDIPSLEGPIYGKGGVTYTYDFSTIEPDGSIVYYYIEWGDGEDTGWVGPFNSGRMINWSHTWKFPKKYVVRVKAKDPYGAESDWGILEVHMSEIWIRMGTRLLYTTIIIRNIGFSPLYNVPWKIYIDADDFLGLIFYHKKKLEGTIPVLNSLMAKRIRVPIIGFGFLSISVYVHNRFWRKNIFVIGPFVFPHPNIL